VLDCPGESRPWSVSDGPHTGARCGRCSRYVEWIYVAADDGYWAVPHKPMCQCGKERDLFSLDFRDFGQRNVFVACREELDGLVIDPTRRERIGSPDCLDTAAPKWVPPAQPVLHQPVDQRAMNKTVAHKATPQIADQKAVRLARRNRRAGVFLLPVLLLLLAVSLSAGAFLPLLIVLPVVCLVSLVRSHRIIKNSDDQESCLSAADVPSNGGRR
jgi:hypothetical protein